MAACNRVCLLATICLLTGPLAFSQGPMGPGGASWMPAESTATDPIQPVSWMSGGPYLYQRQPVCPTCEPADVTTVYELLPEDRFDHPRQAELDTMWKALKGSWVRLDYMHFDVKTPGNTLLGAPPAGISYPRNFFLVDDGLGGTLGQARVLDVHTVDFDNINGARLSFGMPLMFGSFEGNAWALEQTEDFVSTDEIPSGLGAPAGTFIATSLFTNGAPGATLVLSDLSFRAKYTAEAFGAEGNVYFLRRQHDCGVHLEGLLGARYINYREELTQEGLFDNNGLITPPQRSLIGSDVINNIYGVQFGARGEFVHPFFTLGIEPKVMLGANSYDADVRTETLRDITDPSVMTETTKTVFAPVVDLGAYAKIHLHETFSVFVGYNFIWMGNVSRADRNIYYNDQGLANPPAVVVRASDTDIWIQGLTVGGEFRWK